MRRALRKYHFRHNADFIDGQLERKGMQHRYAEGERWPVQLTSGEVTGKTRTSIGRRLKK